MSVHRDPGRTGGQERDILGYEVAMEDIHGEVSTHDRSFQALGAAKAWAAARGQESDDLEGLVVWPVMADGGPPPTAYTYVVKDGHWYDMPDDGSCRRSERAA